MSLAILSTILLASSLSGCTATAVTVGYSPYLEPIPGSITYGGQPRTRLRRAPVGSIVPHQFNDRAGRSVYETYVVEPDGSLRLVGRRYRYDFFDFD
ncbi:MULTISPECIES: hypothetical protein [unclassified Sinorhizobium]|uniref:hypothetical protein n=1 Tax=unclassified Sinorhizobium TaxID=2613772 RepID=UPI0024C268BD|nr:MULTISPECIES: hypothetical protein [unclassified Sinorhizobium]MDK1373330.1 hypothetical protein [Sinorhizobium sp. 6-70]MDK1482207.1 hypothetical protein [Sinorhizobium sp. 6-117]